MTRPVVHLHIGTMKTGTTYLQEVFAANRDALAAGGHVFAGDSWGLQVRATQDLLGLDQHDPKLAALSAGAWDELVAEIRGRRNGSTLVSMEFLSFARRRVMARIARDLAGVEIHVVLTVRDVTATIPAQWQTSVTAGATHSWAEFQRGVQRAAGPVGRAHALRGDTAVQEFRRSQDIARMLRTWGRLVPPERLHVVTVPLVRRDPDELWRRFATAIGADPAVAVEPPLETNPSPGHASTELVRRLNAELAGTLPWDYQATIKTPLAAKILAARRHVEERARLAPATVAFAARWNSTSRAAILASGARVVGDLDDLPVLPPDAQRPGSGSAPTGIPVTADEEPDHAAVLAAARTAWTGLRRVERRRRRRLARLTGRPAKRVKKRLPAWARPEAEGTAAEVDQAVADLARVCRRLMRLHRRAKRIAADRRA